MWYFRATMYYSLYIFESVVDKIVISILRSNQCMVKFKIKFNNFINSCIKSCNSALWLPDDFNKPIIYLSSHDIIANTSQTICYDKAKLHVILF